MYEIPSAARGDEGLEGFSVEVAGERVGRVAALNATDDGLVFVVDTGDAYRPLPVAHVERIQTGGRAIELTPAGEETFGAAPAVEARMSRIDTPRLVRHVPRELDRMTVVGERTVAHPSRLWYVGAPLLLLGLVGTMIGVLPAAAGIGGSARWAWVAVPGGLVVAAAIVLSVALDRDTERTLRLHEKLADAFSVAFGVTPRTRRRG